MLQSELQFELYTNARLELAEVCAELKKGPKTVIRLGGKIRLLHSAVAQQVAYVDRHAYQNFGHRLGFHVKPHNLAESAHANLTFCCGKANKKIIDWVMLLIGRCNPNTGKTT